MAETETTAPAGAITEDAFMANRVKFWDAWTGFTFNASLALVFLLIYLWSYSAGGFSLGSTLVFLVAVAAVFARGLL